ncbi:hypothetical protein AB870_24650 (plasmid) [Pandoraea faecigallinarum]|uniref:Tetratrico peptide repeat group 5 domain-containing protein n=1 Tax=Pandoraea faecigallinarum TaxID=656179 RepID=A0A0H3WZ18_9BURK|nr:hypothetical protein [Pandoraea faecigallinarum]AKM33374.1 hypothetical protein AB870_24650 [Pandoraea faecigallinarum]
MLAYKDAEKAYQLAQLPQEAAPAARQGVDATLNLARAYARGSSHEKAKGLYFELAPMLAQDGQWERSVNVFQLAGLSEQEAYEAVATACRLDHQYLLAAESFRRAGRPDLAQACITASLDRIA